MSTAWREGWRSPKPSGSHRRDQQKKNVEKEKQEVVHWVDVKKPHEAGWVDVESRLK
ncbi:MULTISPECIES: hypothetical protein [unclassified Variovorax]|uniref:hypothetical protein n=1 Tax=unclassified Variovorax TaxID=663243 RepID=UPI0034E93ECA